MSTLNQTIKKKRKERIKSRSRALEECPQKLGTCVRSLEVSPKKPNSGNRKVARVILSNARRIICNIPGIGHNLQKHGFVLARGGRLPDTPGIKYKLIRGKFDLQFVKERRNGRSKYGTKSEKMPIRKWARKIFSEKNKNK